MNTEITKAVTSFAETMERLLQNQVREQLKQSVMASLDNLSKYMGGTIANANGTGKRRGRPPGKTTAKTEKVTPVAAKPRKKMPVQLCPVPGCKNVAVPAYGMVCGDHRSISKSKIKTYREARRAAKENGGVNPKAFQPVKTKTKIVDLAKAQKAVVVERNKRARPKMKASKIKAKRVQKSAPIAKVTGHWKKKVNRMISAGHVVEPTVEEKQE